MNYTERLAQAIQKQSDLKSEIEFLRLQIKQEVKQAKWAKGSPIIQQFKRCWPDVQIDNGAGVTYLSLKFSALDNLSNLEQHLPGWECYETHKADDSLGSPIIKAYRLKGVPVLLYVTKAVC